MHVPEWVDSDYKSFDFETSGTLPEYALQPWRMAEGRMWATSFVAMDIVNKKRVYSGGIVAQTGIPLKETHRLTKGYLKTMFEEALDEKKTLIGWNLVYDVSVAIAYGFEKECFQARYLDGMLLWRHFDLEPEYEILRHKKRPYGLKQFVNEFLPEHAGYEEDIDYHDPDPVQRAKLHRYNKKDNRFTFIGTRHFYKSLEESQLRAAIIEAQTIPMIAKANLHGLPVDTLACHELQTSLTQTAAKSQRMLRKHGVTEEIVRSPKKLAAVMFGEWKLPVLKEGKPHKVTKEVTPSTDKEVLHELSFLDPRAKILRTFREALNNRTKFATAPLTAVAYNEDGRAHPLANMFGTYSGRMTYSSKQGKNKAARPIGFALHQEKRDKKFRAIIIPPPGYALVEFDAAGQEFRWMAIASGDEIMLQLCMPGEDPHSYMGSRIIHCDYHEMIEKKETDQAMGAGRKAGKVANLSLQYRTSAKKLRVTARVDYDIPIELPEATRIRQTYLNTYKGVPKYWDRQIFETKKLGYVETFAGRRVQVMGNWTGHFGWSMGSTAINYRIQGTGADQKYLAMLCIKDYLVSIGGYFIWDLHDGLYSFIPIDKAQQATIDIKRILDNLPYKKAWGFVPPIPMPWDCKTSTASWGDLKEVHFA